MSEKVQLPQSAGLRPVIRRRASAFRDAQRAAAARGRVLRIGAVVAVALALVGTTVAGVMASGVDQLPDDALVAQPMPSDTLIYDRTGKVLVADLHPPGY